MRGDDGRDVRQFRDLPAAAVAGDEPEFDAHSVVGQGVFGDLVRDVVAQAVHDPFAVDPFDRLHGVDVVAVDGVDVGGAGEDVRQFELLLRRFGDSFVAGVHGGEDDVGAGRACFGGLGQQCVGVEVLEHPGFRHGHAVGAVGAGDHGDAHAVGGGEDARGGVFLGAAGGAGVDDAGVVHGVERADHAFRAPVHRVVRCDGAHVPAGVGDALRDLRG